MVMVRATSTVISSTSFHALLATELRKGEMKEPVLEIEAHQARGGVEGEQPDMQLLTAIEAAKVRRVVRDEHIAVIDRAPGHHMVLGAGEAQPAHMARLGETPFARQFRKLWAQAFVDQEFHETAGRSSRRIVRVDFAAVLRHAGLTGGRPRRG